MKYSRFEMLALLVGSISIVWTVLFSSRGGVAIEEVAAQALLLVVLVAAVHWGRKAGTVAGILAILAYVVVRTPMLLREHFSSDVVELVLMRTFTFGVVGIAGGELCSRIRYLLARLERSSNIDEGTQLFNERFITEMLRSMIGQFERYQQPFSIVFLSLPESSPAGPLPAPQQSQLRAVATQIRNDVRLVDDVARLDDGRFLLVLPHTGKAGARAAADRVARGVTRLLGDRGGPLRLDVLGAAEDLPAIKDLFGAEPVSSDEGSEDSRAAA